MFVLRIKSKHSTISKPTITTTGFKTKHQAETVLNLVKEHSVVGCVGTITDVNYIGESDV